MKHLPLFLGVLAMLGMQMLPGSAQTAPGRQPSAQPYIWRNVVMGGGGFVTGIVFHPRAKNLIYARTDVGGAYRWNDATQRWIPLTDWIGPRDNNLTGIESVALDPADAQKVYLAAGMYHQGPAAILRSDDQGETFQRTDVPFKMGGNESGRFNGERLAVDPNDGQILFFGSRHDGLWRSGDGSVTWQRVGSFPNIISTPTNPPVSNAATNSARRFRRGYGQPQPVGIVSVVFDPASGPAGRATPKIFAAVSVPDTSLFASTDAGVTWSAVPNQPVGLRPNHLVLSPDGTFYLTYGREAGPNTMTDGAVWKFDPKDSAWTNITPLKPSAAGQPFGYGAVAVDAQHPSVIMVTTFAHWRPHDLIFRSTDAGANWRQLWQDDTRWDHANAPYTAKRNPHWMGSLAINPFNSGQVLFSTGYGLWSCVDAMAAEAGQPTHWVFLDDGLEETVPLALTSPPTGAHLLSGVGDIDGFRHDDLESSPPEGTFAGPRYSNTEDLAFAGQNPSVIVRAGSAGNNEVRAAFSRDGGVTWQALASEPPAGNGAGTITISADARTIVWTPQRGEPFLTRDWGATWAACTGLSEGIRVVADSVNPEKFYAFDAGAGRLLSSTNGAASFAPSATAFAGTGNNWGATLTVTPGIENDLWLALRAGGLWHSNDGGGSFRRLETVAAAASLGLGKAAPGKNYPALFLAGTVNGLEALFRSDDAGDHWLRINDGRHQYGSISRVTGDPRIYGRVYFATGGRGVIYGDIRGAPAVGKNNCNCSGRFS